MRRHSRRRSLTVGGFRDWLLSEETDTATLAALAPGLTPEMAAAVSKVMRLQDLIAVATKCRVTTAFRNTIGLPGRLSTRLQPNHPTDDPAGIAASIVDGLMYGAGDAVIGINPVDGRRRSRVDLLAMLDEMRVRLDAPVQSCVLAHVTTTIAAMERVRARRSRLPVDRRDAIGQSRVRDFARDARARRARRDCAPPRHGRRQCHVFRDGPG